jgi:SPP1 family phage portal protein
MKIEGIIKSEDQGEVITELKSKRYLDQPDIEKSKKGLDPLQHDVFNRIKRPDKKVKLDTENDTAIKVITTEDSERGYRLEPVARIAISLQKLIVKRAVAFLFGNPVEMNAEPENDKQKQVLKALKRVLYDVKSKSLNRRVARQVMSCTEVAELWYPVERPNNDYGFQSKYKLRVAVFSPLLGDELYPYFDQSGDMVAFSRSFTRTDNNRVKHEYFETYTDEEHMLWTSGASGFEPVENYPKKIEIGKIPVVFANQAAVEWEDVQVLIDRLEKLLSNFADTNDYHASPKIFVTGTVTGFSKKGEAGAIIEGEDGATAEYLAWQNAPESVKLEIETLLRLIYTLTQTPDIAFDAVKGIGAVSGVALKLLFMDAHLKVADHQEVFDEFMQRRVNVIKAFIGKFSTALAAECEALQVEPEIVPFMIEDDKARVDLVMAANGGKPAISQRFSAKLVGLSSDPEADFAQIQAEADRESYSDITEPTI